VQKIGADQSALFLSEGRVHRKGLFHFMGALLEYIEQVAVATLEVLEYFRQLAGCCLAIERENTLDDMICARLVGGVKVPRFRRRFERANDHSGRIGAKIKTLSVQKRGKRQGVLDLAAVYS
jgi:hypothetical protein